MGKPAWRILREGVRVELTCEGKAEKGITGTVAGVRPYQGPRMYADFEYRLVDCYWPAFETTTGPFWVRETWCRPLRAAQPG